MNLKEGQIWQYENDGASNAYLTILKIEERGGQKIIHISIDGVASHLPVEMEFLENSLIELVSSDNPLPDFEEGYDLWNTEFEKGNAGIFSMPVKDIAAMLTDMFLK